MRIVLPTHFAAALALCSLLAACTESKSSAETAPTLPPAAVSTVEVAPEAIPIFNELPGRIAPTRIAEVRPRVSGIVIERVFTQGSRVDQGDVLYRIDPAPFRVQVESAAATLQRAKAVQLQARQHADRQKELGERNIASAQQLADVRAGIEKLAQSAKILCGGAARVHERGYFVAPTLLLAKDSDASILHELEVFGPVTTLIPYSGASEEAARLANKGGGGLVASVYSNERAWTEAVVLGIAPWHGRVWIGSDKVAEQAVPPGIVLPASIHGGPGRAGGGQELGGLRGLEPYLQRTAVQGFQGFVEKLGS